MQLAIHSAAVAAILDEQPREAVERQCMQTQAVSCNLLFVVTFILDAHHRLNDVGTNH
jgi:hypothetical protein